jgi:hypothetical protein
VGLAEGIHGLSSDSDAVIQGSVDVNGYQHVLHDTSYPARHSNEHTTLCDEINILAVERFGGGTIGYPRRAC